MILNTTQNYYIDSFEKYAASAIAAGAVFRSLFGGVVPLFAPLLFDRLGYGNKDFSAVLQMFRGALDELGG